MTRAKAYYLEESRSVGMQGGRRYLNIGAVAARYDRSPSTIMRWSMNPEVDFPEPQQVTTGGHNFWEETKLDEADHRREAGMPQRREAGTRRREARVRARAATGNAP